MVCWAASYSWTLGLTPPTGWISETASPWLVMEIVAVVTGALSVLGGVVLARRRSCRRAGVAAIWLGGFVLVAVTASLVAYVS